MVTDTIFMVVVDLPVTEYRPDQLQVNISLAPDHVAPSTVDFPANYQLTVMFSNLMPDTDYTYTIRVVRRSDGTDVVSLLMAAFSIAAPRKSSIKKGLPNWSKLIVTCMLIAHAASTTEAVTTTTPTTISSKYHSVPSNSGAIQYHHCYYSLLSM